MIGYEYRLGETHKIFHITFPWCTRMFHLLLICSTDALHVANTLHARLVLPICTWHFNLCQQIARLCVLMPCEECAAHSWSCRACTAPLLEKVHVAAMMKNVHILDPWTPFIYNVSSGLMKKYYLWAGIGPAIRQTNISSTVAPCWLIMDSWQAMALPPASLEMFWAFIWNE